MGTRYPPDHYRIVVHRHISIGIQGGAEMENRFGISCLPRHHTGITRANFFLVVSSY